MNRVFWVLAAIALTTTALQAQKAKVVAPAAKAAPIAAPVAGQTAAIKEEPKTDAKPQATAEFKLIGMIAAAYSENTYVLTCGGPKVGFTYGWFGFSLGLFPSLVYSDVYKNANAATPVRPNLGAGPEISIGKIAIIMPVFYMPNNDYRYTFGIGYKF